MAKGNVINSHVTGNIKDVESNDSSHELNSLHVGGLSGVVSEGSFIINSFTTVNIELLPTFYRKKYSGGLVGELYAANISNSYALGNVNGGGGQAGGLVGVLTYGTIRDSYAKGNVSGNFCCRWSCWLEWQRP